MQKYRAMKLPMRAPDWNVILAAIYAFSAPGPAAFLAVGPLLALLAGMLASVRKILPRMFDDCPPPKSL
jgi:hypothetical protein